MLAGTRAMLGLRRRRAARWHRSGLDEFSRPRQYAHGVTLHGSTLLLQLQMTRWRSTFFQHHAERHRVPRWLARSLRVRAATSTPSGACASPRPSSSVLFFGQQVGAAQHDDQHVDQTERVGGGRAGGERCSARAAARSTARRARERERQRARAPPCGTRTPLCACTMPMPMCTVCMSRDGPIQPHSMPTVFLNTKPGTAEAPRTLVPNCRGHGLERPPLLNPLLGRCGLTCAGSAACQPIRPDLTDAEGRFD